MRWRNGGSAWCFKAVGAAFAFDNKADCLFVRLPDNRHVQLAYGCCGLAKGIGGAIMHMDQPTQQEAGDVTEIESQARVLLESHAHFRGRSAIFEFEYGAGMLTVRGAVPTYYLKQMLQCALSNLEGVRAVENKVTVMSVEFVNIGRRGDVSGAGNDLPIV
jgi:hypothetical protein